MKSDLQYVIDKLSSGIFVLKKCCNETGINITTLMRIRDGYTRSPGSRTIQTLKEYFMKAGE
jgi:hypothetical protein